MFQTFITGVEVGLPMSLQMTGDIGCAQHLPTDATSDLAFMSDHVGTESVFGGKSRGTGLRKHTNRVKRSNERHDDFNCDLKTKI